MTDGKTPEGYALVSVLWLLALLTTVTAAYHTQARVEARLLVGALQRAQAEALAEAGIWIALREHFLARTPGVNATARITRDVGFRDAQIAVTIADETGKINLNSAQPELLDSLLSRRSSLDATARAEVVDSILDWRDRDSERRPMGAEDEEYAARKVGHGAKDAPFATVDELLLVWGMTPALYRQIAPLLTVFGTQARVNTEAADDEVLRILAGGDAGSSSSTLRTGDSPEAQRFDPRFVQVSSEGIYTATGTATVGTTTARVAATVRYTRGEKRAMAVLAWTSDPASLPIAEDKRVTDAPGT
jgi:general secretion pathway protein K